jgi:serine/threonine protein kinase
MSEASENEYDLSNSEIIPPKILYIQMEYCEIDLDKYIKSHKHKGPLIEGDKRVKYIRQIIEGLEFLHSINVIFADLKPSNVLLDSFENIKLCDFGLSNVVCKTTNPSNIRNTNIATFNNLSSLNTEGGTFTNMAPELKNRDGKKNKMTEKIDIYALGLIIFEMFANYSTHHEKMYILNQINSGVDCKEFEGNSEIISILRKCLHINSKERPTCSMLLKE